MEKCALSTSVLQSFFFFLCLFILVLAHCLEILFLLLVVLVVGWGSSPRVERGDI